MQSIQLKTYVDEKGILRIQLPDHSGEELEILLVYQPVPKEKKRQWSPEFLAACGAWQGESLVREPQNKQTK
ncbi:MAG: hypothetical protein WBB82_05760 [Limnothrix sp.]